MDLQLAGKRALVTGSSSGIGAAIALGLAGEGVSVVVHGRDKARADAVAEDVAAFGVRSAVVIGSVTSDQDIQNIADSALEALGGIDILVNSAGGVVTSGNPDWRNVSSEEWLESFDLNVVSVARLAKLLVPAMIEAGWGRIINISKNVDAMHRALNSPYGPSKAALEAATLVWAEDLIDTRVTVNSLGPGGSVNTKFGSGEIPNAGMDPSVIVPPALWLASEESDGITGCRYIAKHWDSGLPAAEAAERCREKAVFPAPERETPLIRAWS